MLAVREDGRTVILNTENNTWTLKPLPAVSMADIPAESVLFKYAVKENLFKHYLERYEGIDLKNTISSFQNLQQFGNAFNEISDEERVEYILKGIQYTMEYGKIFTIPARGAGVLWMSNLAFFWEMGELLEKKELYVEAIDYFEKLRELYVSTGEKYKFTVLEENSLETIDGKIYKIKYLLSQSI